MKTNPVFFVFLLCIPLLAASCTSEKGQTSPECLRKSEKVAQLVYEYQVEDKQESLDSALIIMDDMIASCPEWKDFMEFKKVFIYNDLKRYKEAIEIINNCDAKMSPIYGKETIINNLKANEAKENGDYAMHRYYKRKVAAEYGRYIKKHPWKIRSALKSQDYLKIYNSPWGVLVLDYFYTKAQIEDTSKVLNEINSLQNATQGNEYFFNKLKQDIIDKNYCTGTLF